ncbi:MAG: S41 family peptidase [bacterium]
MQSKKNTYVYDSPDDLIPHDAETSHSKSPNTDPAEKKMNNFFVIILCAFLFVAGYRLGQNKNFLSTNFPALFGDKSQSASGSSLPSKAMQRQLDSNDKNIDFNLMWETWEKLDSKFVDKEKLDKNKMFYGAIKGVVASLEDPYTFFLTPEENKQSKESLGGRFEGIGAQLGTKEGMIVVIAPLPNSPALKAGVKAGDAIVEVDGVSIKGEPITQVVSKIRGTAGTTVTLKISRDGKMLDIAIIRDKIQVNIFEVTYENKTAIVKMSQFGDNTIAEWTRVSEEIAKKYSSGEVSNMVLDLRDNPGGYLDAAVHISSEFLPLGELIVKQESLSKSIDYRVKRVGVLPKIPVVVMINKGSASAAEILAGALRDQKRAKLVGEKSFGKGSVQEVLELSGGAGLHVTVAKWVLPGGDWINGKGITPETEVVNTEIDKQNTVNARKSDIQLDKAIELLK